MNKTKINKYFTRITSCLHVHKVKIKDIGLQSFEYDKKENMYNYICTIFNSPNYILKICLFVFNAYLFL